jgi:hypothetical protein
MATFKMKRNDTSPSLVYSLLPTSVVLTGASVVFNMRAASGSRALKVNRVPAVVVTATGSPAVRYDWRAGDTDTSGRYLFEFEVTYSGGTVETFRNDGSDEVIIVDDLG